MRRRARLQESRPSIMNVIEAALDTAIFGRFRVVRFVPTAADVRYSFLSRQTPLS
jgi:hypothetical protein